MKNYRFEGVLAVGTGKFCSLSNWDDNNHPDLVLSRPRSFDFIQFESQEYFSEGLYHIFVDDCLSLTDALRRLKSLLADYNLDFYSSPRYICNSSGSSKITRSVRYLRDNFDFDV